MADLYGLEASGLPPEHIAALRKAQRQQMIAETLMGQANEPIQTNQMAGGYVVPVSPFQGLAKVAQAYMGAKAMQRGDEAFKGVADKMQSDRQAAIAKIQGALSPQTLPDSSAGPPATMERPMDQRLAAVQEAMLSSDPMVRGFASSMNSSLLNQQTREDNQSHQAALLQERLEDRKLQRELAVEERMRQEAVQEQVRQQQFQQQKELRAMIGAQNGGGNPYFTPVQTPDGVFAFNARTGQVAPVMSGDRQIVGSSSSPELQGRIAGAKTGSEAQAKREHNMTGLGDTIREAKSILSGEGGAMPTGSGIGAARDAIAGFAGIATQGSIQAQKLKAVAGALTSKMPRMEGPQSDKDTQLYKEMAGVVGDATIPVPRRLEALKTVEGLWAKYEKGGNTLPNTLNSRGPAAKAPSIESLLEKYK